MLYKTIVSAIWFLLKFTLDDKRIKKSTTQYLNDNYNKKLKYEILTTPQARSDTKPIYLSVDTRSFSFI